MTYIKETFDAQTLAHAKDIVLSPDPAHPDKFREETQYLVDFIASQDLVAAGSSVLDFGCGMGRIAKELIERFGCRVAGIDMSARMLLFARQYVGSERFSATFSYEGSDMDVAVAAFVLQHVEDPEKEVKAIANALKPGGTLVLLDDGKRFVPSGVDAQSFVVWRDDGADVIIIVSKYFTNKGYFPYLNRNEKVLSLWQKI